MGCGRKIRDLGGKQGVSAENTAFRVFSLKYCFVVEKSSTQTARVRNTTIKRIVEKKIILFEFYESNIQLLLNFVNQFSILVK